MDDPICATDPAPPRPRAAGCVGSGCLGGCTFSDGAHNDAACEGDGIAGDREALAVAVGPCGSDLCPEGGFASACDIVDAVGWFGVGGLGLLGHDRLLDVRAATIRGFV